MNFTKKKKKEKKRKKKKIPHPRLIYKPSYLSYLLAPYYSQLSHYSIPALGFILALFESLPFFIRFLPPSIHFLSILFPLPFLLAFVYTNSSSQRCCRARAKHRGVFRGEAPGNSPIDSTISSPKSQIP